MPGGWVNSGLLGGCRCAAVALGRGGSGGDAGRLHGGAVRGRRRGRLWKIGRSYRSEGRCARGVARLLRLLCNCQQGVVSLGMASAAPDFVVREVSVGCDPC